jgi:hypothetical protein
MRMSEVVTPKRNPNVPGRVHNQHGPLTNELHAQEQYNTIENRPDGSRRREYEKTCKVGLNETKCK